ncbi:electron transport complex subunit RsxB [Gammaproteobacteria bacterium AH-315-E17]|nr:electron transport complex subunit RsxB [Gammaproteobacteria bacterium AH-315-E17]
MNAIIEPLFASVIVAPLIALVLIAVFFGALLGFAAQKFKVSTNPLIDQINALLPQTQCAQCGYPGCKPYAEAINSGVAINLCPPGGENTIIQLANLLDMEPLPLNLENDKEEVLKVAIIREEECIGCTFCIQACPVDAIVGAAQQMHSVIAAECTGCELCEAPCPVDCIDFITLDSMPIKPLPEKSLSEQACIRCGLCVDVCPVDLLPQQLYWFAQGKAYDKAKEHRLMDCIECGLCHAVCPSHIPLVQYYQSAKLAIRHQDEKHQQAQLIKQRFDTREQRLAKEKALAEQRRQARAELAQTKARQSDLIQAALERAKSKQASTPSSAQGTLTQDSHHGR